MKFLKKTSENESKQKDIRFVLMPMILGICLCIVCLIGSTYAWFSATQTVGTQNIQTAKYTVEVDISSAGEPLDSVNGIYHLQADTEYNVTLTAIGDASTGYCKISLKNDAQKETFYHTVNFPAKDSPDVKEISFKLTPTENVTLKITPEWGSSSHNLYGEKWESGGAYPQVIEP